MFRLQLKQKVTRLSLVAVSLFTITHASAQTGNSWHLGFGISGGKPTHDPFQFSLGGDIRVQKDFNDHLSGTLTAGFMHWFEKDHFDGYNQYGSPYNVIPVKAGVKLFPAKNFYLGAEAGAGFGMEQWGTSFLWSPSLGYAFNNGFDVSVKYEDFTRDKVTKQVALRLAYGFANPKLSFHKRDKDISRNWQFGVNVNAGLVTTSFEDFVAGAELAVYKPLNSIVELTANAGVVHYFEDYKAYYMNATTTGYTLTNDNTPSTAFPVKAGLRLYAGSHLYVEGQAGVAFSSKNTAFVYAPAIGLQYKSGLDIGIKYENYDSAFLMDQLALRVGYRF